MSTKYTLPLLIILNMLFFTTAAVPGNGSGLEKDVQTSSCVQNCLFSANLNIKPYNLGESTFLAGTVLILDENGEPVSGAAVTIRWTFPDGTSFRETLKTNGAGFAFTDVPAMQNGLYTLLVQRASKFGYRFDSDQGDVRAVYWK